MENLKPLTDLKQGDIANIACIKNLDEKRHKRLIELGFFDGAKIEVLKTNKLSKLMLVGIRGFCLCLDFNLASRVFVLGVDRCRK